MRGVPEKRELHHCYHGVVVVAASAAADDPCPVENLRGAIFAAFGRAGMDASHAPFLRQSPETRSGGEGGSTSVDMLAALRGTAVAAAVGGAFLLAM